MITINMPDFSKSFKFKVKGFDTVFVFKEGKGTRIDYCSEYTYCHAESARDAIKGGLWIVIPEGKTYEPLPDTLLDKIKAFTTSTNASVFIVNGAYEIYYDDTMSPAKASSDGQMEKLMEAFMLIEKASYGE